MDALTALGAAAGALLALSGLAVVCGRLFKWGVREAMEPEMRAIDGRLGKIEMEFSPNHGSSFHDKMLDRLDRIEQRLR